MEKTILYTDTQTNLCCVFLGYFSVYSTKMLQHLFIDFVTICSAFLPSFLCFIFLLSLGLKTWFIVTFQLAVSRFFPVFQVSDNEYFWKRGHLFQCWWVLLDSSHLLRSDMLLVLYPVLTWLENSLCIFATIIFLKQHFSSTWYFCKQAPVLFRS